MAETTFNELLWGKLLDLLFVEKAITIPREFHTQCNRIRNILGNDITGLVNTILNYQISAAAEAKYRIELPNNDKLEDFLNDWFISLNSSLIGKIPVGLKELSKEYFKERWAGSSLCVLRASNWKEVEFDGNKILLPKTVYFVNGSSVYIYTEDEKNFKLGSYEYYLDKDKLCKLPETNKETVLIQKPFSRWFDKYPTPYAISKGIYKNYRAIELLQDKGDEVITKILPYLFILKKGTEVMALQGKQDYTDEDMKQLQTNFKEAAENYKHEKGKVPSFATPFDTELQHLIPDMRNILTEELFAQGYRALLSGLGFVDVVQGISSTRKESVLNPKPFISEVNAGVEDFKTLMTDLVYLIAEKNKDTHKKLFSDKQRMRITYEPLRINTEGILEIIRGVYDRGIISIETFAGATGFDYEIEKQRRQRELKDGSEDIFYPHLVQNQENIADRVTPSKPKNTKETDELNEDNERKPGTPEVKEFNNAEKENLEIAPYKDNSELPTYIKRMPEHAQTIFRETFNQVYKDTNDESKAFPIATNNAKRWCKKNGYTYDKDSKTWVKK